MEGRGGGNPAPQLQTSVHPTIHCTGKGKHTLAKVPNMVVARDRPVKTHRGCPPGASASTFVCGTAESPSSASGHSSGALQLFSVLKSVSGVFISQ